MRPNDAYFDLLIETLEGLEPAARAQFLQRFFRSLSHIDIPENQVVAVWEEVLARRTQLSERSESLVSFQTALVDVLSTTGKFRLPVILEYEELKGLQRNAVTDPLTGLHNRRLFDETFDKELNRARRYGHPLSLVALDLHRFKEVNDKHGHPRGDDVLHAAATTLRKALRTSDSAFRTGGDEFALLLPQTDLAQASALSRRIGVVFSEILRPLNLSVRVSMDHGVATYPQDGDQRDSLIHLADERLYHFKHNSHTDAAEKTAETAAPPPPTAAVAAPPAPIAAPLPIEPSPVQAPPAAPIEVRPSPPAESASPLEASRPAFATAPEEQRIYATPRKAERVSMTGTNAYAVLADQPVQRARVVDLGFGGVALDFPSTETVPETLLAVLHVPILPPVRVSLKRLWTKRLGEDTVRVGCCFIS
jgi:diguanylate cyclase (GGDEF)-like protein